MAPAFKLTANLVGVEKAELAFFYINIRYKKIDEESLTRRTKMYLGTFVTAQFMRCHMNESETRTFNEADELWIGEDHCSAILVRTDKPNAWDARGYYHWRKYERRSTPKLGQEPRGTMSGSHIQTAIRNWFAPTKETFWGYDHTGREIPERS